MHIRWNSNGGLRPLHRSSSIALPNGRSPLPLLEACGHYRIFLRDLVLDDLWLMARRPNSPKLSIEAHNFIISPDFLEKSDKSRLVDWRNDHAIKITGAGRDVQSDGLGRTNVNRTDALPAGA